MKRFERVGRAVERLRERVDEVPLAEEPVRDPAGERDHAGRLELVAGVEERVPGRRRAVAVEPGLVESSLLYSIPNPTM